MIILFPTVVVSTSVVTAVFVFPVSVANSLLPLLPSPIVVLPSGFSKEEYVEICGEEPDESDYRRIV